MPRLVSILILMLIGCEKSATDGGAPGSTSITYPDFDQIHASAEALPFPDRGYYGVTLENHGHQTIVASTTTRQQWRSYQAADPSWQEHVFPTDLIGMVEIPCGSSHTFRIKPRIIDDVQIRFGITLTGRSGEKFRNLVVWSNTVAPSGESWHDKRAEQDVDAQAAAHVDSKP